MKQIYMTKLVFLILLGLLLTSLSTYSQIPHSVIGSGGAVIANSSNHINGTVGQNIIGGASGS
jgi:hypothetical protein